jgi:UDP-N-acetylglucosamine 2-epimerase (non-hydrolysing)/GDP/UDP-N,N'-diacetylbacillosamine 2-epimerase (hydrolysing)
VTSSRADYGHLVWPLRRLSEQPGLSVRLMVTGAHLSPEFGGTVEVIERDGFAVDDRIECLLSADTDIAMAKTIGLATISFASAWAEARPDLLLLIADRYEMLAPASAALAMRVPIAHIEGGEASEGAIDQVVRNALTMMSHLHFTTTARAAECVRRMGEEPWRVHQVGAPSLDHLRLTPLTPEDELARRLGLSLDEALTLATYHPVTLDGDPSAESEAFFTALASVPGRVLFCYPNADAGSRSIIDRVRRFCEAHERARLIVNLEPRDYWSLLGHVDLMVGNSSSGIMESASRRVPAVNIGRRQAGRERPANVIDAPAEPGAIAAAIDRARSPSFRAALADLVNPYGDGRASERIAGVLAEVELGPALLTKRAMQLDDEPARSGLVNAC